MTIETAPDPLTIAEVAAVMRVGRSTVYDLMRRGTIRHIHVGKRILVYKSDLIEWIEANKRGAA